LHVDDRAEHADRHAAARPAIVTVAAEGGLERLRTAGLKASIRAGAVRLSFHLYNTEADVEAVARALGG